MPVRIGAAICLLSLLPDLAGAQSAQPAVPTTASTTATSQPLRMAQNAVTKDKVAKDALTKNRAPQRARSARSADLNFGPAPAYPSGPLSPELVAAVDTAFGNVLRSGQWGKAQILAVETIAASGDTRLGWLLSDFMRVVSDPGLTALLAAAGRQLLGVPIAAHRPWGVLTDHLIAWDIPAPPGYLDVKRRIYTIVVPQWDRLFVDGDIDWRHVSWGGVGIDARPFGETDQRCDCIPAADNPPVSDASSATWLKDQDVVFGLSINGEHRAYPRRIMEVREMVNDTLGGRDIGMPYCTLCGSAQAYFTDQLPKGVERPVLRTSGLLIRSNKVMYDVRTFSVFDTFRGNAVTGPLAERGIKLAQTGVVTTTWGAWRRAHPDTTVLVEALALGRNFDFRNTRDANGPIFPIGDVDERLPVQDDVIGVVTASGTPVAFHLQSARAALQQGKSVGFENVTLVLDGGGVRALDKDGTDLGGHQAFWFAWSQFYPGTELWRK